MVAEKKAQPHRDIQNTISSNAYDIGREEALRCKPFDSEMFQSLWEQEAYQRGWEDEVADLDFVLPYYTKLGGPS